MNRSKKSTTVKPAFFVVALLVAGASRPCFAVTILQDDFEGPFPGPWLVLDQGLGNPGTWDTRTSRYASANHSAYCCGTDSKAPDYGTNMEAWLDYGPFPLSNALSASVTFKCWVKTEFKFDYLYWGASEDGNSYTILDNVTGDHSGSGWVTYTADLGAWCGKPEVWFAFIFTSDNTITDEGAYVDDVLITAMVDDPYEENDSKSVYWDFAGGGGQWLSSYGGEMGIQADEDWFSIGIPAGSERVVIECTFSHADGDIDLDLRKTNGQLVVGSHTTTDDETIDTTVPAAGTYLVVVRGDNAGNEYDLRWSTVLRPAISLSPSTLSPTCDYGQNATDQTFDVWNSGGGTLDYSIGDDAGWLACSPTGGTSAGEANSITVSYTTSGLAVGTYGATITVSDANASNSPQTITVNLTVNATQPEISLSPATLNPTCQEGSSPVDDTFTVQNTGAGTLNYTVSAVETWLSFVPTFGDATGETDSITVNYSTAALPPGIHVATITVSGVASNDPQTITVTLTVSSASVPTIALDTAAFNPTCEEGQNAPGETFDVWNSGTGTLNYTVEVSETWLSCDPTSGDSTGAADKHPVAVTYATSLLTPNTYSATITVRDVAASNSPQTIAVNLTVTEPPPTISLSTAALGPTCDEGQDATNDTSFTVWNSGGGTLNYTIADDSEGWLSCSSTGGDSTGSADIDTITLTYSTSGFLAGNYEATITVSDGAATNDPQTITVSLTVNELAPVISLDPATLDNACQTGEDAIPDTFTVTNSGGGSLDYSITDDVTWFYCIPSSGASTGEGDMITVVYQSSGLTADTHTGTITVTAPGATTQTISVTLVVSDPPPTIFLSPAALNPVSTEGVDAPQDTFTVENKGGGTLNYTITDDSGGWLSCTPASGDATSEADTITVQYNTTAPLLAAGIYQATITVSDPAATNVSQTIAVDLTVTSDKPDLVITSVKPSTSSPGVGEAITVEVTVENHGAFEAIVPFVIDLFCNPAEPPVVGQTGDKSQPVASLDVGASAVLTFTDVTCAAADEWTMYAYVDPADDVPESDESNNAAGPRYVYWGGYEGMFYLGEGCGAGAAGLLALAALLALRRRR